MTTALLVVLAAAFLVVGVGAEDDSEGGYIVRAVFDTGSFLVPDEEVRVAGATVGVIEATEISREDEIISLDPEPSSEPGKAVIVLRITDTAFQDFREDASCIIRPQSLLGERFVDCEPTQPRAPGTEPPPELPVIEEGQPGAGQHLLPLESNAISVDLDLVNNILRQPYRERFSIILNELGAGFAARGEELGEVIERANPALRETDRVLAVLAEQDKTLAQLAKDSDTVLGPLARQRANVAGFIDNAGQTAEASAERRADIEAQFRLLPASLRELRALMIELRGFSDQARPVFSDLGGAAPAITGATKALGPLAKAARPALTTLGDALEQASPDLVSANPVLQQVGDLALASERPSKNLKKLLGDLREKGGFERLMSFVYNFSGSVNGLDQYGHFLRTQFLATNCTDYVTAPLSGCQANFIPGLSTRASSPPDAVGRAADFGDEPSELSPQASQTPPAASEPADPPEVDIDDLFGIEGGLEGGRLDGSPPPASASGSASLREADALFRFLIEPGS
ncbi:MAG: MlaD family protein [Solirubrobacterales bacterium]